MTTLSIEEMRARIPKARKAAALVGVDRLAQIVSALIDRVEALEKEHGWTEKNEAGHILVLNQRKEWRLNEDCTHCSHSFRAHCNIYDPIERACDEPGCNCEEFLREAPGSPQEFGCDV